MADHAGASEVELWLEQAPAGHVRLAVSDDGCGFDPARLSGGGYGFGLTVMAERVEALGGRLAVRAREEGGTMVEACIPAQIHPPGPPRVTRLPPRPRVLLADDHTRLREALRDLLEETGFEVVGESGDGADAVAMAAQLEPDIVVIDLRMPVLNGLDATRLIKDARPATQVVVLSAFESPELERQAREAGAFAYLDKGTMTRRVHRVLLGAAVQAVLAADPGPPGGEAG